MRSSRGSGRWREEVGEPAEFMFHFRMEGDTFLANLRYLKKKNSENKSW